MCTHITWRSCESADSLLVIPGSAAGVDPWPIFEVGVARTHVLRTILAAPEWRRGEWESGQVLMFPCRLSSPVY